MQKLKPLSRQAEGAIPLTIKNLPKQTDYNFQILCTDPLLCFMEKMYGMLQCGVISTVEQADKPVCNAKLTIPTC